MKHLNSRRKAFALLVFMISIVSLGFSYQMTASSNKIVYVTGDVVNISGTISTGSSVEINYSAWVFNGTGPETSGIINASNGTFSFTFNVTGASNYLGKNCYVLINSSSDMIRVDFKAVSSLTFLEARILSNSTVYNINTSPISAWNSFGGNFTDILALNKSGGAHYGNLSYGGATYAFAAIDSSNHSVDSVYVDDDSRMELYNYSEDSTGFVEKQAMKKGSFFRLNITDFGIGHINANGSSVIIGIPKNNSYYSPGEMVHFVVFARDLAGNLLNGTHVNVSLANSTNATFIGNWTTDASGYFVANLTAPSVTGTYKILLNSEPSEVFSVESFSLKGMVLDEAGNPAYSFSENPLITIKAVSKTPSGDAFDLTSATATIIYPTGNSYDHLLYIDSTGIRSYAVNMSGAPTGEYRVKIVGVNGSTIQQFDTGFSIDSVGVEVFAFNPAYIDMFDKGGPGFAVSAFAPQRNATIMVLLTNISAGGIYTDGPPAVIDIDDSSTALDECSTRIQLIELKDESGFSYLLNVTYNSSNFTSSFTAFNISAGQTSFMPDEIKRQCVLRIEGLNKTGIYRAKIKVIHPMGTKISGTTFGVQKVTATADTVDMKGEDFAFFAPNETVRLKLKVTELYNNSLLDSGRIITGKIISMQKEFPTYEDALSSSYLSVINESISNGTLMFSSPATEGFYTMKFRFKANLTGMVADGGIEEGIGTASFMLKKYIVWTEAGQQGKWFIKQGENISLTLNIIDVSQGAKKDMGISSGMSCTGCEGLVANVTRLFNDQRMMEMPASSYTVIPGTVLNSTSGATITIVPASNMSTGWYGVDLQLYNPENPGETYFGWGGFEIRNFFVDMMPLEISPFTGNLSLSDQMGGMGGGSFPLNGSMVLGIVPRIPGQWDDMINADNTTVELESIKWMQNKIPSEVPLGSLSINKSLMNVAKNNYNPDEYMTMWVLNISGFNSSTLNKTGNYQATVRVIITDTGSDIGSFFFDLSTFRITSAYRGQQEWPATFATDELLNINFTAFEFGNYDPHNISNYTLEGVFDNKRGMSLRNNQLNYSFIHLDNFVMFLLNLSNFTDGMYSMDFKIIDNQSNVKRSSVEFQIKNMIVAIPSIEQVGLWRTDTASKELELDNDKDWCYNEKWLRMDDDQMNPDSILVNGVTIYVPSKAANNITMGNAFCIRTNGEWMDGECMEIGNNVYVASNKTHIWVDVVSNVSNSSAIAANNSFSADLRNVSVEWNATSIGGQGSEQRIIVRLNGSKVCGSAWTCDGNCTEAPYTMTLPAYYSSVYHGYKSLVETGGMQEFGEAFNHNRTVYIFHNTSHIWISNSSDLSSETPAARNGLVSDTKGGTWNVTLLNKRSVKLAGTNVLASTGAFINTSLSRTGVFKIGILREDQLGAWNKDGGQRAGIDLNGNGDKNETFYIAISDNSVTGVYDLLYFSNSSNFTENGSTWKIMSINGNRGNRTFGSPDTLTMINIPPRADSIIFHSKSPGDWSELGEYRRGGSNITIPLIARTPSGANSPANITVMFARNERTKAVCSPAQTANGTVSGIGEISVNISNCPAGEYTFALNITRNGISEVLDEWKWPRATTRDYLADVSVGRGGWVSGFKSLMTWKYDWNNYGEIPEISYMQVNNGNANLTGVFIFMANNISPSECPGAITYPTGITGDNLTFVGNFTQHGNSLPGVYFVAFNRSIWMKSGDCDFGSEQRYNESDQINITKNGKLYVLNVLYANSTSGSDQGIAIGVAGLNSSVQIPLRTEMIGSYNSSRWKIIVANISGTYYDAVLSNDTYYYPMCSVWNTDCTKKAWFSTTGNFTSSPNASIGQNFTSDLYVAKIGPGPWDGIIIANFSNITSMHPNLPMFDANTKDTTTVYFGAFDESLSGLDLDMNQTTSNVYYGLAFDDKENGIDSMTSIKMDDDNQITDDFWSNCTNPQDCYAYMDFNSTEYGTRESWQNLPDAIYSGNLFFGDRNSYQNVNYDSKPEWEIMAYNGTDMLIQKRKWWNNVTDNITVITKAYNFNQSALVGANISILKVTRFTPFGPMALVIGDDYNVTQVQNQTNSYGYGILGITHTNVWDQGEYMISININYNSNNQTSYQWFRVSSQPQSQN